MQTQYQRFDVPSATTPGVRYEVRLFAADGVATCSCPQFTFRRKECKHIRATLYAYTPAGRSGALVAQHEATQVQAETTEHGYGAFVAAVALCRCGWQSQPTVDALCELAEHVSTARRGERAAARTFWYDAEADLAAVRRITRTVS